MRKSKDPIRLRQKKLKGGNVSLYLDTCIDNKREYEFLRLYLVPERTKEDRDKNKATLQLAETIRAKRIIDLRNRRFGLEDNTKREALLLPIIKTLDNKNQSYQGIKIRIEAIITPKTTTAVITPKWVRQVCESIMDDDSIKQSTKHAYLAKFRYVLNRLREQHLINIDAVEACASVRDEQAVREFLTAEELRKLMQSEWRRDDIRRMFLFSCFTGLRKSDVERITWGNVEDTADGCRLVFRQKKTKRVEYTAINEDARAYMGDRKKDTDHVFPMISHTTMNCSLKQWMKHAGITKHITYHCARHTFATLLLTADTNIMVVSKLLGHSDVKTTQIYAKVIDRKKKDAVDALSSLVSGNGKVTKK